MATRLLIEACHNTGLACLPHTPNPIGFLGQILARPKHAQPFLLVVGDPATSAGVPDRRRKSRTNVATFEEPLCQ